MRSGRYSTRRRVKAPTGVAPSPSRLSARMPPRPRAQRNVPPGYVSVPSLVTGRCNLDIHAVSLKPSRSRSVRRRERRPAHRSPWRRCRCGHPAYTCPTRSSSCRPPVPAEPWRSRPAAMPPSAPESVGRVRASRLRRHLRCGRLRACLFRRKLGSGALDRRLVDIGRRPGRDLGTGLGMRPAVRLGTGKLRASGSPSRRCAGAAARAAGIRTSPAAAGSAMAAVVGAGVGLRRAGRTRQELPERLAGCRCRRRWRGRRFRDGGVAGRGRCFVVGAGQHRQHVLAGVLAGGFRDDGAADTRHQPDDAADRDRRRSCATRP